MFSNYFIITWRNFLRQKEYALLNILGLAIGLTCCLIILIFVVHETSYDRFHKKGDRIFRVVQKHQDGGGWAWTGGAAANIMAREFREVEKTVALHRTETHVTYTDGNKESKIFREDKFFFSDPAFFQLFDFEILKGDTSKLLREPYFVAVTESAAKRLFGDVDPLGKTISVTGNHAMSVVAVLKDFPVISHIQIDYLTGITTFKAIQNFPLTSNFASHWWPSVWTYVLLRNAADAERITEQLPTIYKKNREADEVERFKPALQAMHDIHLRSDLSGDISENGNIKTVYIFTAIALFTLLLACINFMNLATARASKRSKEIGVRKSVGAERKQLVYQFFAESFFMNLIAMLLAILFADIAIPLFNKLMQVQISLSSVDTGILIGVAVAVMLTSSLLSGSYPALYLSGFKAITILKGQSAHVGGTDIRKVLVLTQFFLSVLLVFCTTIVYFQVQHLKDADLGFDQEHVLVLQSGNTARQNYEPLKTQLSSLAFVKHVTGTSARPGVDAGWSPTVDFPGSNKEDRLNISEQEVDNSYFEMMGIPVLQGRTFSPEFNDQGKGTLMRGQFPAYDGRNFVVNESAVRFFNQTNESIIGMDVRLFTEENGNLFSETKGKVIGVVKDFKTNDLRSPVRPTVFTPLKSDLGNNAQFILVKLEEGQFSKMITEIEKVWKNVNGATPFSFSFLDDDLQAQYDKETRVGNLIGIFALLALFISSLGLFGLSAFTAETRTKEIGIRKVLGAANSNILVLLTTDYLKLVMLAVCLATPLGWYLMNNWLSQFNYRIEIHVGFAIAVGIAAVLIAFFTVSFQSLKAATANPVRSLRND